MSPLKTIAVVAVLVLAGAAAAPAGAAPKARPGSTISFAGYEWEVKDSQGAVGPGPNVFSAGNVKVDKRGRLHLNINRRRGTWRSSEVILDESFGYGTYRYTVQTSLDDLDPNVVLGLFTWSEDPSDPTNSEIDIEFSRWGNPDNPTNAGYTVQPYDEAGHQHEWLIEAGETTTHEFTWTREAIEFRSFDSQGREIQSWTFSDAVAIPDPEHAHARMNLWLFHGNAPLDGRSVHVVISDFEYVSPGT